MINVTGVSDHPSSLALEGFACGEELASVSEHVGSCDACRSFVDEIVRASEDFVKAESLERMLKSSERAAFAEPPPPAPGITQRRAAVFVLLPLVAAAAGMLLWLRTSPEPRGEIVSLREPHEMENDPHEGSKGVLSDPETSFKGGVQIAAIRERDGDQGRFTSRVGVREGDRLRIEVALDRSGIILAGVLAEDGSFLPLLESAVRPPGTHFSDHAARFDHVPTHGWIIVGSEDAIARARWARKPVVGVTSMRVEWEGP